jgi:tetratricopeptide (TPR) repeat protein
MGIENHFQRGLAVTFVRKFWIGWLVAGMGLVSPNGMALGEPSNFPDKARERFGKGQDLRKQGKFQEAIRAFEEAIGLGMKDYPRVHLYRANTFLDLKKYDTAIAQYTRFLKEFSLEDSCRY